MQQHPNLGLKLTVLTVAMFGFGFALVPLYDVFCDLTGLGGRVQQSAAVVEDIDEDRSVRIEFVATLDRGAPWAFAPTVASMAVHPGQIHTTHFRAESLSDRSTIGRAVPSVAPGLAARHLRKIECFCFSEQVFGARETKLMPVVFLVDPDLPEHIDTLTLSYAFFAAGADDLVTTDEHAGSHHGEP